MEEHRYTKNSNNKELEKELGMAEFVPLSPTFLSFWDKMLELQSKMLINTENIQNHIYSSDSPLDWPLLTKGIAYWLSPKSNVSLIIFWSRDRIKPSLFQFLPLGSNLFDWKYFSMVLRDYRSCDLFAIVCILPFKKKTAVF